MTLVEIYAANEPLPARLPFNELAREHCGVAPYAEEFSEELHRLLWF